MNEDNNIEKTSDWLISSYTEKEFARLKRRVSRRAKIQFFFIDIKKKIFRRKV